MSEEVSNPNLHVVDRRIARRILVHVPVEITKIDGEGDLATEHSYIEDVSDFGCRFSARGSVHQGDTIAIKVLGSHGDDLPGEEARFYEVMWVAPKGRDSTVGAQALQGEKLANLKFPLVTGEKKRKSG